MENQQQQLIDVRLSICNKNSATAPLASCEVTLVDVNDEKILFVKSYPLLPKVPLETYISTTIAMFNSNLQQNGTLQKKSQKRS